MEREPGVRDRSADGLPHRAPLVPTDAPAARHRSVRALLAAWAVYWLALLGVQLWPAVDQWVTLMRRGRGTFSFSFAGDLSTGLAWLTIPPLLMTIVWLLIAPRRARGRRSAPPPP
jgi:hypothetical protein